MDGQDDLAERAVLITGGAGFIGSHLADQVLAAGASRVVVLDNFTRGRLANLENAAASGRAVLVEGDIRDRATVARAIDGADIVFHLAAIRLTQCAAEPRLALEVMADGAFNVIEAAAAAGVQRVVAASSASIYGMAEQFPTAETHHPYADRTLYGAAKLFNEGILRAFAETHGLESVVLRPFNVYGPRMDIHGAYTEVLVRWIERIASGQPPVIFGDGSQSMDFVYVEDVARAFLLAATADAAGAALNVASGVETRLSDLAATLLRVMGSDLPPEYGPARAVSNLQRRLGDPQRARALLGFEPSIGLEEGLRRLVDWWTVETQGAPWTRVPA